MRYLVDITVQVEAETSEQAWQYAIRAAAEIYARGMVAEVEEVSEPLEKV